MHREKLGLEQQPQDKNKIYSLHEPHVQCINKSKASKPYEIGNKVTVAVTNRSNWIVGMETLPGNPYDGHTLEGTLETIQRITGATVTSVFVDKGYRGHGLKDLEVHISGVSKKSDTAAVRRKKKRRSAVEPKIGHLKRENRMSRSYLAGFAGDQLNAVLAGAGSNMRKLLRILLFWLNWRGVTGNGRKYAAATA